MSSNLIRTRKPERPADQTPVREPSQVVQELERLKIEVDSALSLARHIDTEALLVNPRTDPNPQALRNLLSMVAIHARSVAGRVGVYVQL